MIRMASHEFADGFERECSMKAFLQKLRVHQSNSKEATPKKGGKQKKMFWLTDASFGDVLTTYCATH